jgi:hypothetical protein
MFTKLHASYVLVTCELRESIMRVTFDIQVSYMRFTSSYIRLICNLYRSCMRVIFEPRARYVPIKFEVLASYMQDIFELRASYTIFVIKKADWLSFILRVFVGF